MLKQLQINHEQQRWAVNSMDDCFEDFDKQIDIKVGIGCDIEKKTYLSAWKRYFNKRSIFYHKGFKGDIMIVKFFQVRNIQDSKQVKQVEISKLSPLFMAKNGKNCNTATQDT